MQHSIPCVMMRGGTSRGLYFRASDLPVCEAERDAVLIAAMGAADPSQIDGAGGGTSVTSKVAIVSPSSHEWADVDYLFVQIGVDAPIADTGPSCGNILAGVGPFAIESGYVAAQDGETPVRVRNLNTGALVECVVQTPGREVTYDGDTAIDGVPGTAAPVSLVFRNIAGGKTGRLLPSGRPRDTVLGVDVTCIDLAMPMVLVAAGSLGKTGYESKAELDGDAALLARLEEVRREAALLMGLGDVSNSVVPKIALLAPPRGGKGVSSRYFTPYRCHAAHAATGAICIAGAARISGTVANGLAVGCDNAAIRVEHPKGAIEIGVVTQGEGLSLEIVSASVTRTARPIFCGQVFVPRGTVPAPTALPRAA
jgi:4-oxalomesaconate tautomerase